MLSPRFDDALVFASQLHRHQIRKQGRDDDSGGIPYLSHLLAVAALVIEHSGSEDQAIAALLHDSIEDQAVNFGGATRLRSEIERRFGAEVLRIVVACSDSEGENKPAWEDRKRSYLAHLVRTDHQVALVSCADKLHNARTILADFRQVGEAVFERFTAKKAKTLWYYRSLADTFLKHHPMPLADELARVVSALHEAVDGVRTIR